MSSKVCRVCQEPLVDSYKRTGHICKLCYRAAVAENKAKNRAWYTQIESKRRLSKKNAQIRLTPEQEKDIGDIYDCAHQLRELGIPVQVDHIDPIQGIDVCGLHVPSNLTILPTTENIRKGNRFTPYQVDANGTMTYITPH